MRPTRRHAEPRRDPRAPVSTTGARSSTGSAPASAPVTSRPGVALVDRIGAAAEEADHHPDVSLTYPEVIVTLTSHDVGGITSRDLDLARRISGFAAELGASADTSGLTQLEPGLDTARRAAARRRSTPRCSAARCRTASPSTPAARCPAVWFRRARRRRHAGAPGAALRAALALRRVGGARRGRAASAGGPGRRRAPGQRPRGAGVLGRRGRRRQPLVHLHPRRPRVTGPPSRSAPRHMVIPPFHMLGRLSHLLDAGPPRRRRLSHAHRDSCTHATRELRPVGQRTRVTPRRPPGRGVFSWAHRRTSHTQERRT